MSKEEIEVSYEVTIPDGTSVVSKHEEGYVRTATEEEAEPVLSRGTGNSSFVMVWFNEDKEIPLHGVSAKMAVRFWGEMALGTVQQDCA